MTFGHSIWLLPVRGGRFVEKQLRELSQGDRSVAARKAKAAGRRVLSAAIWPLAFLALLAMRALRPLVLIRLHHMLASRIGHFAANPELYLCEQSVGLNVPAQRHLDIAFFLGSPANDQLKRMWQRVMTIWPEWMFGPVFWLNRRVPGGAVHEIGENTQHDRDVHNLFERIPPHLAFTVDEERRGQEGLRRMGIPKGAEYVCIVGRDSAYLNSIAGGGYDYHNHRNVEIRNYGPAVEALAGRGCYVIRMGSVVAAPLESADPRIIDYATNGARSDFMDVYLCATCLFCLSCGTGLDAISYVFRKPIAYVNLATAGYWFTFVPEAVSIFKRHRRISDGRDLTLREIFDSGAGVAMQASDFDERGIELVENTPEEITAVAIEMLDRLQGRWRAEAGDDVLQQRFHQAYPYDALDAMTQRRLHGAPRARYGAAFLRENPHFLD